MHLTLPKLPGVAMLRETLAEWRDDHGARLAAALAYYTLLSIAPLVVLTVTLLGTIFGEEAARGQISRELGGVVGAQAAGAIETIAEHARQPSGSIIGSIVGVVVLLVGASGVFGELQSALNAIWQVQPRPGRGLVGVIKDRFFSFTMVAGVAFLLLVSMLASAVLASLGDFFSRVLPGGEALWFVLNNLISFGIVSTLFALVFKVVPDAKVRWHDVWFGAAITALLFTLGKALMGLYLGKSSLVSSYGAAGSLVALVVWVYYSTQILFIGAELTQVYARRHGSRIEPDDDAVPLGTPRAAH
jgi:membrane protein